MFLFSILASIDTKIDKVVDPRNALKDINEAHEVLYAIHFVKQSAPRGNMYTL